MPNIEAITLHFILLVNRFYVQVMYFEGQIEWVTIAKMFLIKKPICSFKTFTDILEKIMHLVADYDMVMLAKHHCP